MSGYGILYLANSGTTGNNTHASVRTNPVAAKLAVVFTAEVVGTTVTWKAQASLDRDEVSDANSAWFDMPYITAASDTLATATIARTTVGSDVIWLALSTIRFVRKVRLVTTANTGVTYRAEMHQLFKN